MEGEGTGGARLKKVIYTPPSKWQKGSSEGGREGHGPEKQITRWWKYHE